MHRKFFSKAMHFIGGAAPSLHQAGGNADHSRRSVPALLLKQEVGGTAPSEGKAGTLRLL